METDDSKSNEDVEHSFSLPFAQHDDCEKAAANEATSEFLSGGKSSMSNGANRRHSQDASVSDSASCPGAFAIQGYRRTRSNDDDESSSDSSEQDEEAVRSTPISATVVELSEIEKEVREQILNEAVQASFVGSAEDLVKGESPTPFIFKRRFIVCGCTGLAILVVMLSFLAAQVRRNPSDQTPTSPPQSFEENMFDSLVRISLDDGEALQNVDSPQYKAFLSLKSIDPSTLSAQELKTRYGLATFYYATNGDEWENNDGWLDWEDGSYCSDWFWSSCGSCVSTTCDDSGGLRSFRLNGNNLQGTLPPEFSLIDPNSMTFLVLSDNPALLGSIPENIFREFQAVTRLDVEKTGMSGTVSTEIGLMTSLTTLELGKSSLYGQISSSLVKLTDLVSLSLPKMDPQSSIPEEIYSLTKLEDIYLSSMQLVGTLSPAIGQLSHLKKLSLGGNLLSGSLPSELGQLRDIEILDLSHNEFSGTIPTVIDRFSRLMKISLAHNRFTGSLPSMANMENLWDIDVESNILTGTFPAEIDKLVRMKFLTIGNNQFSGQIPFDSMLAWTDLRSLSCDRNNFTGTMTNTSSFWSLPSLSSVLLEDNQLSGTIPSHIGLSSSLQNLNLSSNQLQGSIPAELGGAIELKTLNLGNNALTSSIPTEISNLIGLEELILGHNAAITGSVPSETGELNALRQVNLVDTNVTGDVPFCQAEEVVLPCETASCLCCVVNTCA